MGSCLQQFSCTITYPKSHEVLKHHDPLCTGLGLINKCASNDSVTRIGFWESSKVLQVTCTMWKTWHLFVKKIVKNKR